jgi:hypothetical protein
MSIENNGDAPQGEVGTPSIIKTTLVRNFTLPLPKKWSWCCCFSQEGYDPIIKFRHISSCCNGALDTVGYKYWLSFFAGFIFIISVFVCRLYLVWSTKTSCQQTTICRNSETALPILQIVLFLLFMVSLCLRPMYSLIIGVLLLLSSWSDLLVSIIACKCQYQLIGAILDIITSMAINLLLFFVLKN